MAKRKWKGIMTKDLRSIGNALENKPPEFKKGDKVVVWKKRMFERNINNELTWQGKYEYHYSNENEKGLVRTTEFLIDVT